MYELNGAFSKNTIFRPLPEVERARDRHRRLRPISAFAGSRKGKIYRRLQTAFFRFYKNSIAYISKITTPIVLGVRVTDTVVLVGKFPIV